MQKEPFGRLDTESPFREIALSHSGTTLIAGGRLGRTVCAIDNDPVFVEITIRRLEHFRRSGKTGSQTENPFED